MFECDDRKILNTVKKNIIEGLFFFHYNETLSESFGQALMNEWQLYLRSYCTFTYNTMYLGTYFKPHILMLFKNYTFIRQTFSEQNYCNIKVWIKQYPQLLTHNNTEQNNDSKQPLGPGPNSVWENIFHLFAPQPVENIT